MEALVALILLALVAPFVVWPLGRRDRTGTLRGGATSEASDAAASVQVAAARARGATARAQGTAAALADLVAERDQKLAQLAELRLDGALGKLDPQLLRDQERQLRAEISALIEQIEAERRLS